MTVKQISNATVESIKSNMAAQVKAAINKGK